MIKTGYSIFARIADTASRSRILFVRGSGTKRPGGLKNYCAAAAATFLIALTTPLSVDSHSGMLSWNYAHAGKGDGNYGNGKGNGGANGEEPGKSGKGNGDDGNGGNDDDNGTGQDPVPGKGPDQGTGPDDAAEMAGDEFSQSIGAAGGAAVEGPPAGTPAMGLPTVSQLFSLGEDATISAEEELRLISNGWNPN